MRNLNQNDLDRVYNKLSKVKKNKIGEKFLSVNTLSDHFSEQVYLVREVVNQMIREGDMKFARQVNADDPNYDKEILRVNPNRKNRVHNNGRYI